MIPTICSQAFQVFLMILDAEIQTSLEASRAVASPAKAILSVVQALEAEVSEEEALAEVVSFLETIDKEEKNIFLD